MLLHPRTEMLPVDDRYTHRHGSLGHGRDHVLPALVSASVTIPVFAGVPALGIWQSVVLVDINADKGKLQNVVALAAPELGGWRISFELLPEGADTVELRLVLRNGDTSLSETWLYRWTA